MGLMIKRQRDGKLRQEWYGVYTDGGMRKVANLDVPIQGTPPASLSLREKGSPEFEESRKAANAALKKLVEECQHKGRVEHLTERLIESKIGVAPEYVKLAELRDRWMDGGGYSRGYEGQCKAIFERFLGFMEKRNPKARFLYQVRPSDAKAFADSIRTTMSPATFSAYTGILRPAFDLCLPNGAPNPFRSGKRGKRKTKDERTDGSVHRRPFSGEELHALMTAANGDPFMSGLIMGAACTGLRRGDLCTLRWSAVDLAGGMLTVKTSKTGSQVEIPIFAPLRTVLESRQGNGSEYVFPEAAAMLKHNADGLTWRFKVLVAKALGTEADRSGGTRSSAAEVEADGVAAINENVTVEERRERILDTFRRYAAGATVRQIERETGRARSTVSTDLHTVQSLLGKQFMPVRRDGSVRDAIARVTRSTRARGQRAASVRDWHALRTTFVTLALSAGVPMELVRRVTGHTTVDIVLRHYFRPDREQFKAALVDAMPKVLTGGKRLMKPAEELAALAAKLAAGTATEKDKARLRKLAAKV